MKLMNGIRHATREMRHRCDLVAVLMLIGLLAGIGTSFGADESDTSPEERFESKLEARPEILMEMLVDDRDRVEQLLRAAQKKRPAARPWAADVRILFAADVSTGVRMQGK